jgi:hypothetical protein
LTAVADLLDCMIKCDLLFRHDHYSVTPGGTPDAISKKADATWNQGEALFLSRAKKDFDLVNPPGRVSSASYLSWIASKNL